jgi:hypothetical protein
MTETMNLDPAEAGAPLEPLLKLAKEVRAAGALIDRDQARFLVDLYYRLQEHRIALGGQERSLVGREAPTDVVHHFGEQMGALERQMVGVLDPFTHASEVGRWSRAQVGVGPIIAAGFLAHIDIELCPTVGHIWRFAGLDPTVRWNKGEKRPWNADLKVLCWKLGDSFVKFHNKPECFYGNIYAERKTREVAKNLAGDFAAQAAETLERKRITDKATRARYEDGKLPDGRIDLRARRYAVKLFLSHWHHVAYVERFGMEPPLPYPIAHMGHAHMINPPN